MEISYRLPSEAELVKIRSHSIAEYARAKMAVEQDYDKHIARATTVFDKQILPDGLSTKSRLLRSIYSDGQWIGYVIVQTSGEVAFVWDIYLESTARGQGVGVQIGSMLRAEVKKLGCRQVQAQVFEQNGPSLGLCRSLGFKTTSRVMTCHLDS